MKKMILILISVLAVFVLTGCEGLDLSQLSDEDLNRIADTAIVCNSDCRFAQNEKGMCSLNKIDFNQIKVGVFECLNFEPSGSEPLVGA